MLSFVLRRQYGESEEPRTRRVVFACAGLLRLACTLTILLRQQKPLLHSARALVVEVKCPLTIVWILRHVQFDAPDAMASLSHIKVIALVVLPLSPVHALFLLLGCLHVMRMLPNVFRTHVLLSVYGTDTRCLRALCLASVVNIAPPPL